MFKVEAISLYIMHSERKQALLWSCGLSKAPRVIKHTQTINNVIIIEERRRVEYMYRNLDLKKDVLDKIAIRKKRNRIF